MLKSVLLSIATAGMALSPVAASAAPANPAASLSVAGHQRASSATSNRSNLAEGGAGIYAILVIVGIAAIVGIAVSKDDNADSK